MRQALELALEALQTLHDENMDYLTRNKLGGENNQCMVFAREAITAIKEALAQPEHEPVAFPRNVQEYDEDWIIDPAFISRVKHSIDPETPYEFTPSEEQIETTLLALEVIPASLYTIPPQPEQEPVAWINWCAATGKRSVSFECESELASQPLYTKEQS